MNAKSLRLTCMLCSLVFISSLCAQPDNPIIIGTQFSIHSDILDEDRSCLISLPDGYEEDTSKSYPVIILLDGYAHFKSTTGVVHQLSRGRGRKMPEVILIAIENVDRERDFTVTKIKTKRPNTMGGGRNFLAFIEQELIPFLDGNYRTQASRTLIGHSLGGLLSVNAYMTRENLFDAYLVIDPSIWWDPQIMTERVAAIPASSFEKKLYIATANGNYERNKKRHDELYAMMEKKAAGQLQAKIEYFEEENHRSVPLIAIYHGLQYIFAEADK